MTPTRSAFVTGSLTHSQVVVRAPALTMVKSGWRMFWMGVWGILRRRDVTWELGWDVPVRKDAA